MSDANRERWEREADESCEQRNILETFGEECADGYEWGYLAACERHAPRLLRYGSDELDRLTRLGWFSRVAEDSLQDEKGMKFWMYPPAPPPPGGEE